MEQSIWKIVPLFKAYNLIYEIPPIWGRTQKGLTLKIGRFKIILGKPPKTSTYMISWLQFILTLTFSSYTTALLIAPTYFTNDDPEFTMLVVTYMMIMAGVAWTQVVIQLLILIFHKEMGKLIDDIKDLRQEVLKSMVKNELIPRKSISLYVFWLGTFSGVFPLAVLPFVANLDPVYFLMKHSFPSIYQHIISKLFRSATFVIMAYHWGASLSQMIVYELAITKLSTGILQVLVEKSKPFKKDTGRKLKLKSVVQNHSTLLETNKTMRHCFLCYQRLTLIMDRLHGSLKLKWLNAIFLLNGSLLFILAFDSCFWFIGKVPLMTYSILPLIACLMVGVSWWAFNIGGSVRDLSRQFTGQRGDHFDILSFRKYNGSRVVSRTLISLKLVGMQVGTFFYLERGATITIYDIWVDKTIAVLLSFDMK